MPYSRESLHLTWGGSIGTTAAGTDIWQCGIHIADPTPAAALPQLPPQADLDLVLDELEEFHTSAAAGIAQGAVLRFAKIAHLGLDGKYKADPLISETEAIGAVGGASMSASPQDALVITLWSGSSLGKGNYGRFYLPWSAKPMQSTDGRIPGVEAMGALTAAHSMLQFINIKAGTWGVAGADLSVVIMSSEGTGTTKAVTQVRVGDVKDTQRRRRNRIKENYQSLPFP